MGVRLRAELHFLHVVLEREHLDCAGGDEEREAVAQLFDEVPEVDVRAQGQLEAVGRDRVPPRLPLRNAPQAPLKIIGGLVGRGVHGRERVVVQVDGRRARLDLLVEDANPDHVRQAIYRLFRSGANFGDTRLAALLFEACGAGRWVPGPTYETSDGAPDLRA